MPSQTISSTPGGGVPTTGTASGVGTLATIMSRAYGGTGGRGRLAGMRRAPALFVAAGVLLLAACGTSADGGTPTWEPSPGLDAQGPGAQASPIIPVPSAPGASSGGGAAPS